MSMPDFTQLTSQISSHLAPLRAGQTDTMKGLALHRIEWVA